MFQTFETPAGAHPTIDRLQDLRAAMRANKVAAFIVPRADEHQGEYVPACAERLHWISGFTGSAGYAAISLDRACLFVDGRYTVQAPRQVDTQAFEIASSIASASPLSDWLRGALKRGDRVGFDPKLMTIRQFDQLKSELASELIGMKALARNPIDAIWGADRPKPPRAPIEVHPIERSGRSSKDKLADIKASLRTAGQDAVVLTQPDSICWLFNIRGQDVAHTPLVLAFAIVHAGKKAELFIAPDRPGNEVRTHLKPVATIKPPDKLATALADLKAAGARVRLDPASAAVWFRNKLGKRATALGADPCVLPKAIKNETEISGARAAHERDGAAIVRFLHWLDQEAVNRTIDEITATQQLEQFRRETGMLREISFDTISGAGPNGAIVHYRVTTATNRRLGKGELYLVDSGGQYPDGTTDITRTIAIGRPTAEMRDRFTRVLKGHIAIATARFPVGTRGRDLDPFARRALWQAGLDFDHGTGHGVGSFLSVHEGPASISRSGAVPIEAGMILSNEPGYYKEGAYGIRIENLVLVTEASPSKDGDRLMLGFETLTLAPIDRTLIEPELLSPTERAWIDAYHKRVAKMLAPNLPAAERTWLKAVCTRL